MHYFKRTLYLVSLAFLIGLYFASPASTTAQRTARPAEQDGSRASSSQEGRVRPPASITCDRNNLTAYTGKVTDYSRRSGLVKLVIQTDWDTIETVTLQHPSRSDASKWFLLRGKAFRKSDWSKIEFSRGRLRPNMRASAWVCNDGSRPIIDWQFSTGNGNPPRATP